MGREFWGGNFRGSQNGAGIWDFSKILGIFLVAEKLSNYAPPGLRSRHAAHAHIEIGTRVACAPGGLRARLRRVVPPRPPAAVPVMVSVF